MAPGRLTRFFSTKKTFKFAKLSKTLYPSVPPDFSRTPSLKFGTIHTPHMFQVDWSAEKGWEAPVIKPFENLSVHPFNSSIHYAITAFDAMKAYKDSQGKLRLFRPEEHASRFRESCERASLPTFEVKEFLECLYEFVRVESDWVRQDKNFSLYLRPVAMSTTNVLGVKAPESSTVYIVACPSTDYWSLLKTDDKGNDKITGLRLAVNEDYWRGNPYSACQYKLSANYAPTIAITKKLHAIGFSQAIWTFEESLLESGATNLFFVVQNKAEKELVTHPLDHSILPGVVRDSILSLAKQVDPSIKISERPFKIPEFIQRHNDGSILEVFVSGTGALLGPVETLRIREKDYHLDMTPERGQFGTKMLELLRAIQYGEVEHKFSKVIT